MSATETQRSGDWHVARTIGRPSRAALYINRAGVRAFWPELHRYFIDRSKVERFRKLALYPGYVFFQPRGLSDYGRVLSAIGVRDILGYWQGSEHVPSVIPSEMMNVLIAHGPVVEGRRKKFNSGDKVAIAIAGVNKIIGIVISDAADGKVRVMADIFGKQTVITAPERSIDAA